MMEFRHAMSGAPRDIDALERAQGGPAQREVAGISPADPLTPADRYQELFVDVQMSRVFEDSKTFVDCVPLAPPEQILDDYRHLCFERDFDLQDFIARNFATEALPNSRFVADPERNLKEHIASLWPILTRQPRQHPGRSSLLPLPDEYLVPGGRFSEMYYWDSYFTMLALQDGDARARQVLRAMADNFAYLIDTFGHVPNGNRSYYLSRSQPPVFCLMVQMFEEAGLCAAFDYLPQLRKEYAWWMDGERELRPGEAHRRCVRLEDGALLNRYWDDRDSPREESYAEDVLTARRASRPVHEVYRDLRAAAESGWDFSSRWLDDDKEIASIRTTGILPVDLNCFLLELEKSIGRLSARRGDAAVAEQFEQRAARRHAAIDHWMWNEEQGAFFDYDWQQHRLRPKLTAATVAPLFIGCASADQARRVAEITGQRMLAPGGLSTTEVKGSGQQWDRPNGWAPLQWMAVQGLKRYGHEELAGEIAHRWLAVVSHLYQMESKLVEKYILRPTSEHAGGGEYPLQDGFGWTNGVVARLLGEYPGDPACNCRAGGSAGPH